MLQALLYLLIGSGAVLSVAGLLYGASTPRRPGLIVGSVSLALLVAGLWRLESGNLPIHLPRHVIAVVDCKGGALDVAAASLSKFDNVASVSVVLFDGGSRFGCASWANGDDAFQGLNLPAEPIDLEAIAGRSRAAQCGIETTGVGSIDQLNDIACGIELALERRGLQFRTRVPSVVMFLEAESQLGKIPRDAPEIELNVRETMARLIDQDVPISTFFVEESRSIGRTATLETRNALASEFWSAKTVFVLTLRDEALIDLADAPPSRLKDTPYRLKGTFRSLGGPGCSEVTELKTQEYPRGNFWLTGPRDNLIRSGERPEELQIAFAADHLQTRSGLVPRFPCDGWVRLEVEATIRINGEDVRFPVTAAYFRQGPVPSATLIVGNDEGRLTKDTWYDAGTSAPDTIDTIREASTTGYASYFGHFDYGPLVREGCSFRMSDLESGASSTVDLVKCLSNTEAVLLVEPTADDTRWLASEVDLTTILRERGRIAVVIGPPAQSGSGTLPRWIRPSQGWSGSEQGQLVRREHQLYVVPDRGLLARAAHDGIRRQQEAIDVIARQSELRECGTSTNSAGVIDFTRPNFGLDRKTMVNLAASPQGERLDMMGPDAAATYSMYRTAPMNWGNSTSLETYLASHALLQLAEFVKSNGDLDEWEPSIRHATTVVLFAANVYQPGIDALPPSIYTPGRKTEIKHRLNAFFQSGARIVVVELPTEVAKVPEVNDYLKTNAGAVGAASPYASVRDFAASMGLANQVFSENLSNPIGILAKAVGNSESISRTAFGRGFDSEMGCIGYENTPCDRFSTDSKRPAPERHLIIGDADPLDAASVRTSATGETIYTEHHYGHSRIHTLGYSPLARDFIERDTQTTYPVGAGTPLMFDRCFLDSGRMAAPDRNNEPGVRAWADGWGFTRLIDLVRHSAADIIDEQDGQIVAIEEALDGQSVDVFVRARPGSNWSEPEPIPGYAIAPIDYDPVERLAKLRINRDPSSAEPDDKEPLTITSLGQQERIAVKLLPLETSFSTFEIWRRVAEMSSGTGSLYGNASAAIGRYGIAALSILVILFALIVLSPLTRRWTGFLGMLRRLFERQGTDALRTMAISGFSVEAVLSEWGANPGKAGTGRHAGIPLGVRTALKDDSLASVIWADLAGLVAPDTFPFKKPRVRLRSLSQTKESVVVVDDTGALRYPSPSWQIAGKNTTGHGGRVINVRTRKSEFAARLAAVVARGLRQTGSVKIVSSSATVLFNEVQPDADSAVLTETFRNRIHHSNAEFSIHREQFSDDESNRLLFLIADPLCTAVPNIEKLAERMASNGGELRLALIVSESDRNPASLALDLSSSGFIDRTEWTRYELAVAMEKRIEQLRTAINAHGARLAVLDADMTSSEVLTVIRDCGLLD